MNVTNSNQKTIPLVPVEEGLLPNKNRVDLYRSLVSIAIKENLPPVDVETAKLERLTLFLPPLLAAKVNLIAEQQQLSFQQAFAGLTAAGAASLRQQRAEMTGITLAIKAPFNAQPEQLRFYQGIQAGLSSNKIVLAEGSTGIGKGRALCAVAIEAATAAKIPVVIAAPTLKVLGQLWQQMNLLRHEEHLGRNLSFAFFPGATEFVNETKLKDFMANHNDDPDVTAWIKKKGKILQADNPLVESMAADTKLAWLMEDLRTLAINFPAQDFALRSEDECQTNIMLNNIRLKAREADVIFCTHAMLAISQMTSWRLVPEPAVLVIDEAHQFEQSVAAVHGSNVSLFSLINKLRESKSPTRPTKAIRDFIGFLRHVETNTDLQQINLKAAENADETQILKHLENIANALTSKSHNDVQDIAQARQVFADSIRSMEGQSQSSAYVSFSPDRRFPSLMAGKANINKILGGLWKSAQGGVVLASATLYIPDAYGEPKSDYIATILALPNSRRVHAFRPVIADWVTRIPVLHTPLAEDVAGLSRPNKSKQQSQKQWINHLVGRIRKITQNAKGGTLILTTSYSQISAIAEGLIESRVPKKRLIIQQRDKKLALSENEFRLAHANGLRPIWISLGAAWTGLDLRAKDESIDDTVLTDLIIACCPIGLNRTNTMNSRINNNYTNGINVQPIIKEALMMLKQGLGRLMRHKSQKDRHIWFLDGRIWSNWEGMENFQKSAVRMLDAYKNREPL